jgi:ATP-dependent DNA helicase RecG
MIIHGDLFTQVEQALAVLKLKYLKALISYGDLYREETYPVPLPALRESLLNAVVHKDYASAIPIQISVYPDQLMIWNPGVLPDNWTLEDLLGKHASKPFNPDIANAFFRAGLIESWGRGIERINQACLDGGFPVPEWKLETGGLWTVFYFSASYLQAAAQETTQETTQKTTQEKILRLLKAEPSMTRQQLAQQLDISADGIKYHLEKLKRSGKLKRIGSTKTGIWELVE